MIRRLARVAVWACMFVLATIPASGGTAYAYSFQGCSAGSPSAASYSIYVASNWNSTVLFNGQYVPVAYEEGYDATPGSPSSCSTIIIDFHRQEYNSTSGWGVLEGSSYESDSWAFEVASEFIQGYSAGHTVPTIIGIGVSNDDDGWAEGSALWSEAGSDWAGLVDTLQAYQYTTIEAADDIEGWSDSQDGWHSYGSDTVNWETAYSNAFISNTGILQYVADYGSEAYNEEGSPYWSQTDVYYVSWGLTVAVSYPEIYCNGQQTDWGQLFQLYPGMFFSGASSENGSAWTNCYGATQNTTYTWQESWQQLNNQAPGYVGASTTIF